MPTRPAPLELPLGDDVVIPLALFNADGTVFNLTGGSVRFAMVPVAPWNATPLLLKTTPLGVQITSAPAGTANLVFDAVDTATMPPGPYAYAVQATGADGKKATEIIGTIIWLDNPAR